MWGRAWEVRRAQCLLAARRAHTQSCLAGQRPIPQAGKLCRRRRVAHLPCGPPHRLGQPLVRPAAQRARRAQQQRARHGVAPRHCQHDCQARHHAQAREDKGQRQHGAARRGGQVGGWVRLRLTLEVERWSGSRAARGHALGACAAPWALQPLPGTHLPRIASVRVRVADQKAWPESGDGGGPAESGDGGGPAAAV